MLLIMHFFFGILAFWMSYGNAFTGNEITFFVYTLGGFFTFWIVVFIKLWWAALLLIVLIGLVLYLDHKYKIYKARRRIAGNKKWSL